MTNQTIEVAVIMGSDSDLPVVEAIFPILDSFGIKFTKNVMSAHRTPHESGGMGGIDSLLSTAMMPPGVPVATVAVGKSGAKNSAILAVQILATSNEDLSQKLHDYKNNMREEVLKKDKALNS